MRNKTFDKIKAVACILVILIHCKFPSVIGDLFEALARFGVPMFFAIAGVYLAKKNDDITLVRKGLSKKLKKTSIITLKIWGVYTVYSFIYAMAVNYGAAAWFHEKFNLFEFSRLILFNSGKFIYDFTYAFDHLWYLLALIYVYGLCYIFAPVMKTLSKPLAFILILFLYFGEFLQLFYPIRPFGISVSVWYVIRNWLFVGIPFTMLGYWMKQDEVTLKLEQPLTLGSVLSVTGVFLTFAEYKIFGSVEVYFGSLFLVVGLLIVGLNAEYSTHEKRIDAEKRRGAKCLAFIGENLSSNIYYFHVLAISFFGFVIDRTVPDAYANTLFMYLRPIFVIIITILISLLLYMVKFITVNSNKNLRK
jgi:hypothetical protein